jgi:hypothetical protein
MLVAVVGILVVAAVTTAGDYLWFEVGVGSHHILAGIAHGVVLLTAVGGALGATAGRLLRGLPMGAIAGASGACVYYGLSSLSVMGAMIAGWGTCWLVLAGLDGRWLRQPPRSFPAILVRGMLAALSGALAFWLVLDTVWGEAPATGRNYALQFAAWAFAWAPGLLSLTTERP